MEATIEFLNIFWTVWSPFRGSKSKSKRVWVRPKMAQNDPFLGQKNGRARSPSNGFLSRWQGSQSIENRFLHRRMGLDVSHSEISGHKSQSSEKLWFLIKKWTFASEPLWFAFGSSLPAWIAFRDDFELFLLGKKNSIASGRKPKISGRNLAEKFWSRQSSGREFSDFVLETKEVPKMYI